MSRSFFTPSKKVFFFCPSWQVRGRENKGREEREKDGRHCRWQCGGRGSTRVDLVWLWTSRVSGYFPQIIGNFWMFSVCRRSSDGAGIGWLKDTEVIHDVTMRLFFFPKMTGPCQKSKWNLGWTTTNHPWTGRSSQRKTLTLKDKDQE
jgi:hypothetical protein